jgi:hypothetical protein
MRDGPCDVCPPLPAAVVRRRIGACFVVRDHSQQALAYIYNEPGRRSAWADVSVCLYLQIIANSNRPLTSQPWDPKRMPISITVAIRAIRYREVSSPQSVSPRPVGSLRRPMKKAPNHCGRP